MYLQVALDNTWCTTECRLPGEHMIGEESKCVDVGSRIHRLAAHLLRSHRRRRSQHAARRCQSRSDLIDELHQAEIQEDGPDGPALSCKDHIGRLDVAMYETGIVG